LTEIIRTGLELKLPGCLPVLLFCLTYGSWLDYVWGVRAGTGA